jgi:PAS domain S-box-containing protein
MKNKLPDKTILQLQQEIETLRNIIALLPGNIYWKDVNGVFMGCNNNVARILNIDSPEKIIGKSNTEMTGPEMGKKLDQIDADVIKNEKNLSIEEIGFSAEGSPAVYLTQKSPLYNRSGKIHGLIGVSFDITERKKMETKLKIAKRKAEAANRAKSRFLATISHELRTPLTSVLGFAHLIEKPNLKSNKKKEYIQHMINSGTYLLSLINDLLNYNKLETNKYISSSHTPFNLKKLMKNIILMLQGTAKTKNLMLSLQYEKNMPEFIINDRQILQQILTNLIGNAIKFTHQGKVTLKVTPLKISKNAFDFQIAVEDTGIGIASREQRAIFKQFYQLGNVYTRNTSQTGTGLGLAIVKKLMKFIRSKIQVKSSPNKGSTFYFNLHSPIVDHIQEKNNQAHILLQKKKIKKSKRKYRVLLVEDDPLIQIVHKKMLASLNCQIDVADNANIALKMLENPYHILFVDIGLADIDGFKLIKKIRQGRSPNAEKPIIALTGYSTKEDRKNCIKAGANEVAIKPISKAALENTLKRHVKIK